jgi:predicted nucleic acid-binding protein
LASLAAALRSHRLVGIDTPIFIYHLEQHERFGELASAALEAIASGRTAAVTSPLTVMELAVRPYQMNRPDLAEGYASLIGDFPNLTVAPFGIDAALVAARMRASYRLRSPDAAQIGVCLHAGATAFLTNDRDLRRVQELDVLMLTDLTLT